MAQTAQTKDKSDSSKKSAETKRAPQTDGPAAQHEGATPLSSALTDPLSAPPAAIARLQRQAGNRAVQRLIQRAQTQAQREAPVGLEGGEVSGDLQGQIDANLGGGRPLDKSAAAQIGGAMGADFSGVRVHTGSQADGLNRSLSAKAFTTGSDIFFSQGAYNPGTHGGKELLAHELTHVVQQGGAAGAQRKPNKIQTKLTVGPAGDKYEEEADQVAGQVMRQIATPEGFAPAVDPQQPSVQRQPVIQRRSNKLKVKAVYTGQAKSGFKLFGSSKYQKILNAVDAYHGLGGTDYMLQLHQLAKIGAMINDWEISHGLADTTTASKNQAEGARRGVLSGLRTTDLPEEIADVYQQAKTNGDQPDVHLLMQLMDAAQGNPGVRGVIESDYGTALRSYQANGGDTAHAQGVLGGGSFFASAGGSSLDNKLGSVRGMSDDPSDGRISAGVMDSPISQTDSDTLKEIKRLRAKLRTLVPALANISDVELMAVMAYTDEGGYTPMNSVLRGGRAVSGGSKDARKRNAGGRAQVQQANLMASSALNKLPNWSGATVFRGEDIGWLGTPTNNQTVVLKSFTSTTVNGSVAKGFAGKGTPTTSAVWEISNVTNQGKDISKLSLVQQDFGIGTGMKASGEDEVLLKPYTRLRITNITAGDGYRYHIEATAL